MELTSFTSIFYLGQFWFTFVRDLSAYIFDYTAAEAIRKLLYNLVNGNPLLSNGVDGIVNALIGFNPLFATFPIGFMVLFWLVVVLLCIRVYNMLKSLLPTN